MIDDVSAMPGDSRLAELILPLAVATDLGTGEPLESSLRACLLALRLGEQAGLSQAELSDVYYVALLRWTGCTAESPVAAAIFGDERGFRAQTPLVDYGNPAEMLPALLRFVGADRPLLARLGSLAEALGTLAREGEEMARAHCEVAQKLAARLGLGSGVQAALLQASERWDGRGMPRRLRGEAIALPIRLVHLAQNLGVFHRLGGVDLAVRMAQRWAGGAFDPNLAEQFICSAPSLCQVLAVDNPWQAVLAAEPHPRLPLTSDQLEAGARVMADFVDLKSPYTVGHSSAVARLAAGAAKHCRLPESDIALARQAGYVHDLGQVGLPAALWLRAGPLSELEWERVRLHPYHTERLVSRSRPLARQGVLAGWHHERLDGTGYPHRVPAASLPPLARILGAAEVYQALLEPRTYRAALAPEPAAVVLRQEVRAGRLDGEAVQAVLSAAGQAAGPARRAWAGGLSEREVEVLRLLARGLTNKEIAARLGISKATANHHVRHIYDKLDVTTRAAATLFAMQHNLV